MPGWRVEPCAACGKALEAAALVLVEAQNAGGTIALVSPARAKVCDEQCLLRWVRERARWW